MSLTQSSSTPTVPEWTLAEKIRLLELFIDSDKDMIWEKRAELLQKEFSQWRMPDFFEVHNLRNELHRIFSKPNPEHHIYGMPVHPRGKEAAELWLKHFRKEYAELRERKKQMYSVAMRRQLDLIRRYQQGKLSDVEIDAALAEQQAKDALRSDRDFFEAKIKDTLNRLDPDGLKNIRSLNDYCNYMDCQRVPTPPPEPEQKPETQQEQQQHPRMASPARSAALAFDGSPEPVLKAKSPIARLGRSLSSSIRTALALPTAKQRLEPGDEPILRRSPTKSPRKAALKVKAAPLVGAARTAKATEARVRKAEQRKLREQEEEEHQAGGGQPQRAQRRRRGGAEAASSSSSVVATARSPSSSTTATALSPTRSSQRERRASQRTTVTPKRETPAAAAVEGRANAAMMVTPKKEEEMLVVPPTPASTPTTAAQQQSRKRKRGELDMLAASTPPELALLGSPETVPGLPWSLRRPPQQQQSSPAPSSTGEKEPKREEQLLQTPPEQKPQLTAVTSQVGANVKLRSSNRRAALATSTPSSAVDSLAEAAGGGGGGGGLFLRPGNHTSSEPIPRQTLLTLWKDIHSHRHAYVFDQPVQEEEVPGYHLAIKKPMDLKTLRQRIESGAVQTFGQFRHDILLMFANAVMYNSSGHYVNTNAKEMLNFALKCIEVIQHPFTMWAPNHPLAHGTGLGLGGGGGGGSRQSNASGSEAGDGRASRSSTITSTSTTTNIVVPAAGAASAGKAYQRSGGRSGPLTLTASTSGTATGEGVVGTRKSSSVSVKHEQDEPQPSAGVGDGEEEEGGGNATALRRRSSLRRH